MAQIELNYELARANLPGQTAQTSLVRVGRYTGHELAPELLSQPALQRNRRAIINGLLTISQQAKRAAQLIARQLLHSHQQAAAFAILARPALNRMVNRLPATQIKIAHTEIRPRRHLQCILQGNQ